MTTKTSCTNFIVTLIDCKVRFLRWNENAYKLRLSRSMKIWICMRVKL